MAIDDVDKMQRCLDELNSCVDEHNDKVDDVIKQLGGLNDTVKELEKLISYIKWLQRIEELRCFYTYFSV